MKKIAFFMMFLAVFGTTALGREVNVIYKDKSVVKGDLIGMSAGSVFLQQGDKAEEIKTDSISGIFDAATGEKIPLAAQADSVDALKTKVQAAAPAITKTPKPMLFIFGTLDSGLAGYVPCKPLEGTYVPGNAYVVGSHPYDLAWGAGVGLEYKFVDALAGCFDAGVSRWEKLLARENGYGVGDWVWEQNGYMDARVGPFPMDVKYYMDTTVMRLGAKYYPMGGIFQPWIGALLGCYAWQAIIGNIEKEKKYGEISSGFSFSPSFQAGIDFVIEEFALRIFGDFGTAVANPKFENLFRSGWTFENTGGEHVQGPYRFGIALGMAI